MLDLPLMVRKEIRKRPRSVRAPPQGLEKGKTPTEIIFNNPRSSIKPGSAPDPTIWLGKGENRENEKGNIQN